MSVFAYRHIYSLFLIRSTNRQRLVGNDAAQFSNSILDSRTQSLDYTVRVLCGNLYRYRTQHDLVVAKS